MPSPVPSRLSPAASSRLRVGALRPLVPGLLLSLGVGVLALALSRLVPAASPALLAIVLGALAANTVMGRSGPAELLRPGLAVSSRTVLRVGIALLGLQLALGDVLALGPVTVLVVVAVVGLGMGAGLLAGRALKLPLAQTVLISCGFSICGAAAVAAANSVLATARRPSPAAAASGASAGRGAQADPAPGSGPDEQLETQTATAIALVVLVGTLMIPLVPLASGVVGLSEAGAGTWAGASILEVAQVVAAGSMIGQEALGTAVLVKLARVLMLAPVIALLAAGLMRASASRARGRSEGARPPLVPMFIIVFLVAVGVRSLGFVPMPVLDIAAAVQSLLLAAAMFALGTGVRARLLTQVGARPVVLAVILLAVVTVVGLAGGLAVG